MCQLLIQIIGITLLVSDRYRNRTFPLSYPKSATPVIERGNQYHVIAFLEISGTPFTSRISNFNELVINNSQSQFYLIRDERQPGITAKVGKERIQQLKNSANGNFVLFNKEDRILFDLIYDLIISIHNKDLDIDLESALTFVTTHQEWYHWIFTKFGFTLPKQ